jgi:GxxExxY protein
MKAKGTFRFEELNPITEKIIGCVYSVSNGLGTGFLEKVYENALAIELRKNGLKVEQQKPITIRYEGAIVGEYFADFVINEKIILEVKAIRTLENTHMAQCLNYLKATGLSLALLINFGTPRVQIKRIAGAF